MSSDLFELLLPWLLILLAMVTGTLLEKAHFNRIRRREKEFLHLPALNTKQVPADRPVSESALVMGDVVVSIDYFSGSSPRSAIFSAAR